MLRCCHSGRLCPTTAQLTYFDVILNVCFDKVEKCVLLFVPAKTRDHLFSTWGRRWSRASDTARTCRPSDRRLSVGTWGPGFCSRPESNSSPTPYPQTSTCSCWSASWTWSTAPGSVSGSPPSTPAIGKLLLYFFFFKGVIGYSHES